MRMLVIGDFGGVFSEKLKKKLKKEEFDLIVGLGDYAGIKEWKPFVMYNLRAAKKGKPLLSPESFFGKKRFKNLLKKDEERAKYVLKTLDSFGKPVIFIFGNGDDDWYNYPFARLWPVSKKKQNFLKKLKNFKNITYGKKKFMETWFVGFGGYMDIDAYFDRKIWKQDSLKKHLKRLKRYGKSKEKFFSLLKKTKAPRIFVFHYPPKGAFDIIKDTRINPLNGESAGIGFFTDAIKKYKPQLVLCGHMHEYSGIKRLWGVLVVNPGDAEKGKYAIVEVPDFARGEKGKIKVKFRK
jgi:Icc-related predicted phosphoesterase